jgi:hypothetical protein
MTAAVQQLPQYCDLRMITASTGIAKGQLKAYRLPGNQIRVPKHQH